MNVGRIEPVGAAFRVARLLTASLTGLAQIEGLKLLSGMALPHPTPRHRAGRDPQNVCPEVSAVGDRRSNPRRNQRLLKKTQHQGKEK